MSVPLGYLPVRDGTGPSKVINCKAPEKPVLLFKAHQLPFQPMATPLSWEDLMTILSWGPHGYIPVMAATGARRAVSWQVQEVWVQALFIKVIQ